MSCRGPVAWPTDVDVYTHMKVFTHRIWFLILLLGLFAASFSGCTFRTVTSPEAGNANTPAAENTEPELESMPASGGNESSTAAAAALVTDLYKQHDAEKGPFRERKRAAIDKYFAKPLADMIWKDQQSPAGEIGIIDFDPLYDGQDISVKKFTVGTPSVKGERITVPVSFENFGEKKNLTFEMLQQGDTWKIGDIKYPSGLTLLGIFRENLKTERSADRPSSSGEFEGRYRVGETTCSVKPVRMAFEVKWAKGSGSEYFFYKDENVFESEPDKTGGRNEFRFEDENYDSGIFVRSDGKKFSVTRVG